MCARSPFFRNLVARRLGAQVAERPERGPTLPQPFRIVLDETVIPQKYARVLVRALYVDSIDFDLVDEKNIEIGDRFDCLGRWECVLIFPYQGEGCHGVVPDREVPGSGHSFAEL